MARSHEYIHALNAGGVDSDAVSRIDLEKMRIAGEHPVANYLPRVVGPMTLRPGLESLGRIPSDVKTRQIRFLQEPGSNYLMLLTPNTLRISHEGAIVTVPEVATAINPASWTDVSGAGSSVTVSSGSLTMLATDTTSAKGRQSVSVSAGDQVKVNILRIDVGNGPVTLRVGTTAGGEELVADTKLGTGMHKIGFTPGAATIYVEIRSDDSMIRFVAGVQFESTLLGGPGELNLPTPWATDAVIASLRSWQSIDVLFVGDGAGNPMQIERRGPYSWSIVDYTPRYGPYLYGNTRTTLSPTGLRGNVSVNASQSIFRSTHVGAWLELTQTGKTVSQTFNASGQTSDYITIYGVSTGRVYYLSGTSSAFVGTVVVERSFEAENPTVWTTYLTYIDGATAIARFPINDGQDNLTVHYRIRSTAYTSGSSTLTLEYESGTQVGQARITGYTSPTQVSVEVYTAFGNTSASKFWRIGDWSDANGWPRVPAIMDDRMYWFRRDKCYGSIVDDYDNYNDSEEGDSAPLTRSVGSSHRDGVLWALTTNRMVVGTASSIIEVKASELDEPITQTRFTVRPVVRHGSADIPAVEHASGIFFVHRSKRRLYDVLIEKGASRFSAVDVSRLNPAAFRPGIVRIATQQQPDTRLYAVLQDGTCAVVTYEVDDKVVAVSTIATPGGVIEDVEVLPGIDQDDVYFMVRRNGTQRYHERLAPEAEQTSAATCALLDAHKVLSGSISSITGGVHLASRTVQVWADGLRRTDVTLDGSGYADLGATYGRVVYGIGYDASFKSTKLAYAAKLGTAIGQTKIVHGAGIVLANSTLDGLLVGSVAGALDPMPDYVNGALRTPGQMFTHYDGEVLPVSGEFEADARLYIEAHSADGPKTISAIVLDVETRDGAQAGN